MSAPQLDALPTASEVYRRRAASELRMPLSTPWPAIAERMRARYGQIPSEFLPYIGGERPGGLTSANVAPPVDEAAEVAPTSGRMAEYGRCTELLRVLCPDADEVSALVVHGEPYSKARPRVGAGGAVYNSAKQRAAERALSARLREHFRDRPPMSGNVAVVCLFYRSRGGRIDADNLLKQVMDAANGICWHDDYQVTAMVGIVELDRAHPRTVIAMAPHTSTMVRTLDRDRSCAHCGKTFRLAFPDAPQRYCSRQCGADAAGIGRRAPVACAHCGTVFTRRGATQRYCSHACRIVGVRSRRKVAPRLCPGCQQPIKNRLAARCRACWRVGKGASPLTPLEL